MLCLIQVKSHPYTVKLELQFKLLGFLCIQTIEGVQFSGFIYCETMKPIDLFETKICNQFEGINIECTYFICFQFGASKEPPIIFEIAWEHSQTLELEKLAE